MKEREVVTKQAIMAAREIQEYLWGKSDGEWGLANWLNMLNKRLDKIAEIDVLKPNSIVELRKRLLQNAALSIAMLEVLSCEKGAENIIQANAIKN